MQIQVLHNKATIYDFLKLEAEHHIFSIGDLDDFFWPKTIWYSLTEAETIRSIALVYIGMETPTLLLFANGDATYSKHLLNGLKSILPQKFNAHLSPGLIDVFGSENVLKHYGFSHKMVLRTVIDMPGDKNLRRLTLEDIPAVETLLSVAYPQHWFDPRMILTGKYFGYFDQEQLVGVAGVHVYSEKYRVAALGNIATHPDFRGQRIASKVTSALCHDLKKSIDMIGLNVRDENRSAIKCYLNLGFETIGSYDECLIRNEGICHK